MKTHKKIKKILAVCMILIGALGGGFITLSFLLSPSTGSRIIGDVNLLIIFNAIPIALVIGGIVVWKCRKFGKKLAVIFLLSIGIAFVAFMIPVITTKSDISDIPGYYGTRVNYSPGHSGHRGLKWYDTPEEALKKDDDTKDLKKADHFYIYKTNREVLYFSSPSDNRTFRVSSLKIQNGKYSQVTGTDYFTRDYSKENYLYDCDDAVSEDIAQEFCTSGSGNGSAAIVHEDIYFGMWSNLKEAENLTILGKHPEVRTVTVGNQKYAFWMIQDPRITAALKKFDFSGFTLKELTDTLDIDYKPY